MSYFVEFGQSRYEGFYQEFLMLDATTGDALPSNGIDHQFKVCGEIYDYGDWYESGQIIASNSNGLIYLTTQRGISAIKIPPDRFGAYSMGDTCRPLRCALIAVPAFASDAKLILTGTITFGEATMNPRLTLKVTPYYPAPQVPSPSATQVKIQLATQAGDYNLIEAALSGDAVDPARLTWATGGPVTIGGPLANVIQTAKAWNATAMAIFLTAAAGQPT